ncbi:aspartate/glutamate racemase family protein [Halomarina rubra]|uniref:Aspartate/glutamate racemase family protein n=1 Tax=Halomarina rubra TaxID=2071873 RepID=A0ABD6AX80_9EURY|nr:aspartate/glutamate racemase family protein [Halomarina rubra]
MSTPEIAYLIPGVGLADEELARRERIANELTTGSVTVVETTAPGPSSIESGIEEAWAGVSAAQTGYEIREEFDAIVIGCFGDPGLRALREVVDIPVVGPAQATFYTAAQVADRFAWLTILDSTKPMSHEQATEYGLPERCVSVRTVDAPVESIDHESDTLVDRMVKVGREAVEEDGAEALFPGCMSLSFAQRHDEIRSRVGVPFLDPAGIALEQAASWARHGIAQSRRTYPEAPFEKLDGLLGTQAPPADD